MPTARLKAQVAMWVQWGAVVGFGLATVPPMVLLLRAQRNAEAIAGGRLTWEFAGTLVGEFAAIILQTVVLRDGCFGVCAFPPVMPLSSRSVFWLRVGTQVLFWSAMLVGTLTVLKALPMYLGMVVSLGLLALYLPLFNGLCLALGYREIVPSRLRFFFALAKTWTTSRLWGRRHEGERSCVTALKDEALSLDKRLLAMELIGLRCWIPGGLLVIQEIAEADDSPAPLAARAREILVSQPILNHLREGAYTQLAKTTFAKFDGAGS